MYTNYNGESLYTNIDIDIKSKEIKVPEKSFCNKDIDKKNYDY